MHTKVCAHISVAIAVTAELLRTYKNSRSVSDTLNEEIGQDNICA